MVNARNELGAGQPSADQHHRAFAISNDGGSTFGPYKFSPELIEPVCMAGLINFHGVLYFSNPVRTCLKRRHSRRRGRKQHGRDRTHALKLNPVSFPCERADTDCMVVVSSGNHERARPHDAEEING